MIPLLVVILVCLVSPAGRAQPRQDMVSELLAHASKASGAGDFAAAARAYEEAFALWPHLSRCAWNAALAHVRAGNHEKGLQWLSRVAEFGTAYEIDTAKELDPVRTHPDFAAVQERFRRNLEPMVRSTVAFTLPQRDLMPESVAYDPVDDVYYLGSIYRRKVVRVDRKGQAQDFVPEARDGLWGVLGIKLDPARRELWVNASNLGAEMAMAIPDTETVGQCGVFRYDLKSGALIQKYLAGNRSEPVAFNDLTLAPNGDVYISAGPDGVYRIDRQADVLAPFLPVPGAWINGIAIAPDGESLYFANSGFGIEVVNLRTKARRLLSLPAGVVFNGVDGLYVHGESLVGIQNGVRPERVVQGFLSPQHDRITRIRVLESAHPSYDVPTTGVIVGNSLIYIATTQLGSIDQDGKLLPWDKLKDIVVLKLDLSPP